MPELGERSMLLHEQSFKESRAAVLSSISSGSGMRFMLSHAMDGDEIEAHLCVRVGYLRPILPGLFKR